MSRSSTDLDYILALLERAGQKKVVGFDYETNAIRPFHDDAKILTIGCRYRRRGLCLPIRSFPRHVGAKETEPDIAQAWCRFLTETPCRKVSHQLSFELEWTAVMFGERVIRSGPWGDSVTQAWVLDERKFASSLDFLCLQHFGFNLKAISDLDRNKLAETDLDTVLRYNALDAKYHRLLYLAQNKQIKKEGLDWAYEHMLRRIPTMALTQIKGVPINQDVVKEFYDKFTKQLENIEAKIAALDTSKKFASVCGYEYRPSAPKDTKFVLDRILESSSRQRDRGGTSWD